MYRKDVNALNEADDIYNKANDAYQKTEERIKDMRDITPNDFKELDNCQYKDSRGHTRSVDVIVKTSENIPGGNRIGNTNIGTNTKGRLEANKMQDVIIITIEPNARRHTLSHEKGHVIDILYTITLGTDGKRILTLRSFQGIVKTISDGNPGCQNINNVNHPRVKPAMDAQYDFDDAVKAKAKN